VNRASSPNHSKTVTSKIHGAMDKPGEHARLPQNVCYSRAKTEAPVFQQLGALLAQSGQILP
jgi:hypothetical protein